MSQTRRFIQPYKIINSTSMAASFNTASIDISNIDDIAIVYEWSGVGLSPIGVIYVEVRNGDECPWSTLDVQPIASIASDSGDDNIMITNVSFQQLRLLYTRTSGSGTLNAWLTGKGR